MTAQPVPATPELAPLDVDNEDPIETGHGASVLCDCRPPLHKHDPHIAHPIGHSDHVVSSSVTQERAELYQASFVVASADEVEGWARWVA